MRTLRVLLVGDPAPAASRPWARVDDRGQVLDRGHGPAATWPAADQREAVLAATSVRIVALDLPPLPPDRVQRAVAYALEERLATPLDASVVVAGPQAADGSVRALVAGRTLAATLAAHAPRFDRIVAEPALARRPPDDAWRWCASPDHGFVLTPSGEAFGVGASEGAALPAELKAALDQAARAGRAPLRVVADVPGAEGQRDAWTRAAGVPFERGAGWDWATGDGAAADDLAPAFARALAPAAVATSRPSFALAATLLAAAAILHVAATLGTWGWRKLELARTQQAIVALAREAGVAEATEATAVAALAQRHADARHRAGRTVAGDAWPRLAQAAPALAALPPATLRTARWSAGAWTLDLGTTDEATLAALDGRLRDAGVAAVAARSPAGARIRLEGAP
jgi:hypothetical protein